MNKAKNRGPALKAGRKVGDYTIRPLKVPPTAMYDGFAIARGMDDLAFVKTEELAVAMAEAATTRAALARFVECIESTHGVVRAPTGFHTPRADRSWSDLGEAYIGACEALGIQPTITDEE